MDTFLSTLLVCVQGNIDGQIKRPQGRGQSQEGRLLQRDIATPKNSANMYDALTPANQTGPRKTHGP